MKNIVFEEAKRASFTLLEIEYEILNNVLFEVAECIEKNSDEILAANADDLAKMEKENPLYDRLLLNSERLYNITKEMRNVADMPQPCDKILEEKTLENGILLQKKTVPFGVIGVIFEARPNVAFDVFSLCFKSRNSIILKGSKDAHKTNLIAVKVIKSALHENNINENCITLLPVDYEWTLSLLNAVNFVDLVIPRGGKNLIDFVRNNSKVPVIETGAGVVHIFVDEFANLEKANKIALNAKTRRVSVCNALDCLLIAENNLVNLSSILVGFADKNVKIYADESALKILKKEYPVHLLFEAKEENFGLEYLSLSMAIKSVKNIDEALEHIRKYGSKHSDAIVTENKKNANKFCQCIDSAAVYVNCSTAFTDGAEFGLGSEIGISTQKMHARGPMALNELTSYKWIGYGNGQIRN